MNRDALIAQTKAEFARRASRQSRSHPVQSMAAPTPEAHYERLLGNVLQGISAGTFDSFTSGADLVDAVELDPGRWLPNWKNSAF